jgi:tRNA G18 (ribose-2'-O)-methylase SpoU
MSTRIDDPDHPDIVPYLGLRDHAARQLRELPDGDMADTFMAEGDTVIERALGAGLTPVSVLIDGRRTEPVRGVGPAVSQILAGPDVLEAVCGRRKLRDPIARFLRPAPNAATDLLRASHTVAVLEGVVNPTNLGVIMRCLPVSASKLCFWTRPRPTHSTDEQSASRWARSLQSLTLA